MTSSPSFFETTRLRLRIVDSDDAELILTLVNTPKWIRYIGDRKVRTLAEARAYIQSYYQKQQAKLGFSTFTIMLKESGQKIGLCGLYDRESLDGIDLGFAILPQYEGKGYTYEAACQVRDLAFEVYGLEELKGITVFSNLASQSLLQKLGMTRVKTIEQEGKETLVLFAMDNSS